MIDRLQHDHDVVAVVRSESAADKIRYLRCQVEVIDYEDTQRLASAGLGCACAIHLVGIIKRSRRNRYEQAHERPSMSLLAAAKLANIKHIIGLSIVGSDANSDNGCFASRGLADSILMSGGLAATILRIPMVLGEGDYAARALTRKYQLTFRASSLEQPIYSGDVIAAICALINNPALTGILELAGPESLSRRKLFGRAGKVLGFAPVVISLPVSVGRLLGRVLELLMATPPVTRDMIDLLDHDDAIDTHEATTRLGISLTGLDETLARVLEKSAVVE